MDWVTIWVLIAVAVLAIVGTLLWKRFYKPKSGENHLDEDGQREVRDAMADIERNRRDTGGFGGSTGMGP